jgi:hypothetical protein
MQNEHALLVDSLDLCEPHIGPCDRFADRFSVGLVILLCLHERAFSRKLRRGQVEAFFSKLERDGIPLSL